MKILGFLNTDDNFGMNIGLNSNPTLLICITEDEVLR